MWVRRESQMISAKNAVVRNELISLNVYEQRTKNSKLKEVTENRSLRWQEKTKNSPYAIDLLAENERIMEETRIRENDFKAEITDVDDRTERAKNDIIIRVSEFLAVKQMSWYFVTFVDFRRSSKQALAEFSDLEALRREKRAILEEEQRLKSLLQLEKSKKSGKESRMAAERAQKQRQQAKLDHRRSLYRDSLDAIMAEESLALRRKHGV